MNPRKLLTPREVARQICAIPERFDLPEPRVAVRGRSVRVTWIRGDKGVNVLLDPVLLSVERWTPLFTKVDVVVANPIRFVRDGLDWLMRDGPQEPRGAIPANPDDREGDPDRRPRRERPTDPDRERGCPS